MSREAEVIRAFGSRMRVRVCGLCIQNGKILLVKHSSIGALGFLWAPPGGGLHFGETVEECLLREFREEVGLTIKVNEFLFVYEFLKQPFHSVELFFKVEVTGGELKKGKDPELPEDYQMIAEVQFCNDNFITSQDRRAFHKIIQVVPGIEELEKLRGYFHYRD